MCAALCGIVDASISTGALQMRLWHMYRLLSYVTVFPVLNSTKWLLDTYIPALSTRVGAERLLFIHSRIILQRVQWLRLLTE